MAKTTYKKKIKNGKEYFFYRLRHETLIKPKDIYSPTLEGLKEKIKKVTTELDRNVLPTKLTFGALFDIWLFDVHSNTIKQTTMERYYGVYINYIKSSPLYDIQIQKLKSMHIQSYYNTLFRQGKSSNIIKTINLLIAPCIRYAFNNDLVIKDFSRCVTLPKKKEKIKAPKDRFIIPFTLEEQQIFINTIKGHELEMLFITALNTGMRQGELLALTWDDVDFKNNCIYVNKSIKRVIKVSKEGKGSSDIELQSTKTESGNRTIPMPVILAKLLKQHKIKQMENKLRGTNYYTNNSLVFCNPFGKYLNRGTVLKKFKKILKENGIQDRKFHDLRHTYATRLFELGENPKVVQTILGHSNISVTLDTYTHVLDSMKNNAVSKLNDLSISMGL